MAIEYVRVSEVAKDQLIKLKRWTGIKNWNTLCRWAFCASLAEPSIPAPAKIRTDSNVEIEWKIFGGPDAELYMALLKVRCHRDELGTDDEVLAEQFKLHLHRGIGYLAADKNLQHISGLLRMSVDTNGSDSSKKSVDTVMLPGQATPASVS